MKFSDLIRGGVATLRGLATLGGFKPPETKQNPVAQAVYSIGSLGQPMQPLSDEEATLNSIRHDVWAFVGLNAIGATLSSAPIIGEQKKSVDGEPTWVPVDNHPVLDLIRRPNDFQDDRMVIWGTAMTLVGGRAHWVIGENNDVLYPVHPAAVKLVLDKNGVRQHYEIGRGTSLMKLPPERIIHFTMPSPNSMYFGASAIEPVKRHILIDWYYTNVLRARFKEGAFLPGLLSTEYPNVQEEDIERMREKWREQFQGIDNAFKRIPVLWKGMNYQTIGTPLGELAVDLLARLPREAVLAACGVPPVAAGIYEFANDALARSQTSFFWQNQIIPRQDLLIGTLNRQFVPLFADPDTFRLRFDRSMIQALKADKLKESAAFKNAAGLWLTPNEIRKKLGEPPHDSEVADTLFLAERGAAGGFPLATDGKGGGTPESPPPQGKASLPAPAELLAEPHSAFIQIHKSFVQRKERSFAKLIRGFFDDQLDRLLEKLKQFSVGDRALWTLIDAGLEQKDDDGDAGLLFNVESENEILLSRTKNFIDATIKETGQNAIDDLGIGMTFDVKQPEVQAMIDAFQNRSTLINDTTYEAMKQVFKDAYDAGEGIAEIEKRIRQYYKENAKYRAERTAKTEMNGMVNGGNMHAYRQGGYTKKKWQSAFLSTSRQHHMDADGQTVDMDSPFEVGGELLMHPSAPGGSPGNVINCYCGLIPVEEE